MWSALLRLDRSSRACVSSQGIVVRGLAGTTAWTGISGKLAVFPPVIGETATAALGRGLGFDHGSAAVLGWHPMM
ncbi:hypothetical protein AB0M13_13735 [Nocardia fluminea]|uniref:hypothetical protein n=1 Tax=Nocardia fluminea TaxID=134984 RepID=UPI0034492E1D